MPSAGFTGHMHQERGTVLTLTRHFATQQLLIAPRRQVSMRGSPEAAEGPETAPAGRSESFDYLSSSECKWHVVNQVHFKTLLLTGC